MKIISLLLKVLIGVIVTIAIAVGVIVATVDPNDYRDEITQVVKKETGRDLTIDSISLSLFPHLGLNLENSTLSNATGFSQKPFLHIDKVEVGAAIIPLLSQQLEVDALRLYGLDLNLEKNAQGVSNWDDLVKPSATTEVAEAPTSQENPLKKLAALNFGGIDIQNSQIHWNDVQNAQAVDLTIVKLSTESVTFGEFFKIALSAESRLTNPEIQAALDLTIEAKIELDGRYSLRNLAVNTHAQGAGIPVDKASAQLTISKLNLALAEQKIQLPEISLTYSVIGGKDFPAQKIQGQLQLSAFSADLSSQTFKAEKLTSNTDLTADFLPNKKGSIALSVQPAVNLTKQTASLSHLSLSALGLKASGAVKANQITSEPAVDAQLKIAQTNLRALLTQLKLPLPEMANKQSLTKFSAALDAQFKMANQALNVKNIELNLDDSQLKGQASVSQFDRPNIRYDLALNRININHYLPPKTEQQAPEPPASTEEFEIQLPTELLRKLTIDGRLKVGSATFDKLQPKNILVTVKGKKGIITASPVRVDIFNSRINLLAKLDVSGKTPKYTVKTDGKKIPVGDVLVAVADTDILSGNGSVDLNITTAGSKVSHFKKNLNGTAKADLLDGAIKGFNLAQSIRNAKAKLGNQKADSSKESLQTDFSSLLAHVSIKNGVVKTEKLLAQAPFMRITGSGTVNLPKESLNYLVKAKIVGSDKGQGGEELQELNGLTIPVKLKGNYLSPKVSLELGSLLEEKTKAELAQKKAKIQAELAKEKAKIEADLKKKRDEAAAEARRKADKAIEDAKKEAEQKIKDSLLKGLKF